MTRLCDHLIIYHQGRQCFHKLPRPGAACTGINNRLSPNTQLLITTGEGWPDVARRGTLGPCLAGGRESWEGAGIHAWAGQAMGSGKGTGVSTFPPGPENQT